MTPRSEYDDYDDEESEEQEEPQEQRQPQLSQKDLRNLRRAAKERDDLKAELAKMKREQVFVKAGIDPDSKKAKYFVKGYEGELTVEAVKAEAAEAGLLVEDAEGGEEGRSQVPEEERTRHQRMDAAAQGAKGSAGTVDWIAEFDKAALQGQDAVMEVARRAGLRTPGDE